MGFWGNLAKIGLGVGSAVAAPFTAGTSLAWLPGVLGAGGAALSGMGKDAAANRGAQFDGQQQLAQLLLDREQMEGDRDSEYFDQGIRREQEGRAGRNDAWRQLLHSQRVLNPTPRPNVSPYQAPQRQITDTERGGAEALSAEVMQRLQGGNPIQAPTRREPIPMPQVDPRLLQPGGLEKTSGWLAPLLGYLGQRQGGPINNPAGNASMPIPLPPGVRGDRPGGLAMPNTSDPTRLWPIDPATGLKRPPTPAEQRASQNQPWVTS